MQVESFRLFATQLLAIQFDDAHSINDALLDLFATREELADGFNMHPDALNLLQWADTVPAIRALREMFLQALSKWLAAETIDPPCAVDLVLFSNFAAKGEATLVHNHNADVVGIYYVRTPPQEGPAVRQPAGSEDYFDAGDGLLVLHDPCFNANLTSVRKADHVKVYPRAGLMLLFPGYLWHSVTPHQGMERRLSLSMNFTLHWPANQSAVRCQWK